MEAEQFCVPPLSPALKLHHACMLEYRHHSFSKRGNQRRFRMKLFPIAAVVAVLALAPTAFAQQAPTPTPTNKVDCEKAKMKWDEKGGKEGKGAGVAAAPAKK